MAEFLVIGFSRNGEQNFIGQFLLLIIGERLNLWEVGKLHGEEIDSIGKNAKSVIHPCSVRSEPRTRISVVAAGSVSRILRTAFRASTCL